MSKITSALNLNTSKKGFFPHNFNRLQNVNYFGPYTSKKHYGYQNMSDSDQVQFYSWYWSVAGQVFDFKKTTLNVLQERCRFVARGLYEIQREVY